MKICNKPFGCIRYPEDCSITKGTCKAYALTELIVLRNKTVLKFELSWLSDNDVKSPYVGLILSKSRSFNKIDEDVMILCHQNGVSIPYNKICMMNTSNYNYDIV